MSGYVSDDEVAAVVAKSRTSIDKLSSTDIDTSDVSDGEFSSLWESSDRDDTTSDVVSEDSTEFSGSQADIQSDDNEDNNNSAEDYQPPQKKIRLDSSSNDEILPTRMITCSRGGGGDKDGGGGDNGRGEGNENSRERGASNSCARRGGRGGNRVNGRGRGEPNTGGRGRGRGRGHQGELSSFHDDTQASASNSGKEKSKPLQVPKAAVNISECDTGFQKPDEFCPLRSPGPSLPELNEVSALSLFESFFNDSILDQIVGSTYAYAEAKKDSKKGRYKLFMKKNFDKKQLMAFFGALILLGIHNVRNHRKAWSTSKAQVIYRLRDLLTCQQFELIGAFLHVVTPSEEAKASGKPLRKLQPLIDHIKHQSVEFYQPRKELSVDERMVKSKARCHFIQYMRNKPVKWGFKL